MRDEQPSEASEPGLYLGPLHSKAKPAELQLASGSKEYQYKCFSWDLLINKNQGVQAVAWKTFWAYLEIFRNI